MNRYGSDDNCELHGSEYEYAGHTANTACCVCGGGIVTNRDPSPSSSPSQSQLPTASYQPTDQYRQLERNALIAFFESTNGEGWSERTNWLTSAPICDWYGVICTEGAIERIVLGGNNLGGKSIIFEEMFFFVCFLNSTSPS